MKITKTETNFRRTNSTSFKGVIPQSTINYLANQNTASARKLLNSCLGFNAVYRGAENLNPDRVAREMADKFNINTDFGNNPLVAAFSALTANIFHKLDFAQPTNIYLRNLSRTAYDDCLGLCTVQPYDYELTRKFGSFPLRSVIMNEAENWGKIQEEMLRMKGNNHCSTGHFLAPFIHEFIHSAHLKNLNDKHGNGSAVMRKLQKDFKNKDTIALIKTETSNYGSKKPCEMVAEEMTELIVDSLNPKTLRPDELIFKMLRQKENFTMDKLLDACWNGDIKQVEIFRKRRIKLLEDIKSKLFK